MLLLLRNIKEGADLGDLVLVPESSTTLTLTVESDGTLTLTAESGATLTLTPETE